MTLPVIKGPLLHQSEVCNAVLRALPEWFGIERAILQYVQDVDSLPTFIASMEGETAAFLTLKLHNVYSAEIYVMGVYTQWHRYGIGKSLLAAAEKWLRDQDIQYLQVKTLADKDPNPNYAHTRAFYFKMGFRPLEVIEDIWGPENPCLVMVKSLQGDTQT
jgi:GNAT superfamily N-acetyltransferase